MAKSMLGSLVLESSLMICSANRDFTPLLGNEIDVDMATEGETWDNVKERSTQIYEELMRVINTLLVKITEKTDPATVSAKIKEVNAEMKNDESKTTVNVPQGDITKKLAAIDKKLKKAKADLKKFRNKQITATYSKAQKSNDIKRYRSIITVCNRAYSAWAQIVIHGMSKEHKD